MGDLRKRLREKKGRGGSKKPPKEAVLINLQRTIISRANIPAKYKNKTFVDYDNKFIPENQVRVRKIMEYAAEFSECLKTGKSIYIFSDNPGVGKTFLACALLQEIAGYAAEWFYNEVDRMPMIQYGVQLDNTYLPVYFADSAELVDSRFEEESIGELSKARRADFLVLDDVFNERDTEFALGEVAKLINHRYKARKPTIFTSNHKYDELVSDTYGVKLDRVASRLDEMCGEYKIRLDSYLDYRQKNLY